MSSDEHMCPRRAEAPGSSRFPGPDRWTTGHGLVSQKGEPSCSYCGSLNPDRFMDLVRDGWMVEPTDKSYKVYLGRPYSDEEIARHKARWVSEDRIARAIRQTAADAGATPAEQDAAVEREWTEKVAPLHVGTTVAKFYFQHLSDAQQQEFIDLLNAKRVRFGYPGYLYVLPYFCRRGNPTDSQA